VLPVTGIILPVKLIPIDGTLSAARLPPPPKCRIDLLLTGMNGRELAVRALQTRPMLRVLYMTGSRNAVVHQGRLDQGVNLLQKPITQARLASRIRELLDQSV